MQARTAHALQLCGMRHSSVHERLGGWGGFGVFRFTLHLLAWLAISRCVSIKAIGGTPAPCRNVAHLRAEQGPGATRQVNTVTETQRVCDAPRHMAYMWP